MKPSFLLKQEFKQKKAPFERAVLFDQISDVLHDFVKFVLLTGSGKNIILLGKSALALVSLLTEIMLIVEIEREVICNGF